MKLSLKLKATFLYGLVGFLLSVFFTFPATGKGDKRRQWFDTKTVSDFFGEHAEAQVSRYNSCAKNSQTAQNLAEMIAAFRRDYKYTDREIATYLTENYVAMDAADFKVEIDGPSVMFEVLLEKKAIEVAYEFAPQYQKNSSNQSEYDAGDAYWNWCTKEFTIQDFEAVRQKDFKWNEAQEE